MMILIHAASATLAVVLGGLLLARNKRLPFHTRFGAAYHWTMLVVALSALAISLLKGLAIQVAPRLIPHDFIVAHRELVLWTLLLGPALLASPFIARTRARWIRPRAAAMRVQPDTTMAA